MLYANIIDADQQAGMGPTWSDTTEDNFFSWRGSFEPRHEKTCIRGLNPG